MTDIANFTLDDLADDAQDEERAGEPAGKDNAETTAETETQATSDAQDAQAVQAEDNKRDMADAESIIKAASGDTGIDNVEADAENVNSAEAESGTGDGTADAEPFERAAEGESDADDGPEDVEGPANADEADIDESKDEEGEENADGEDAVTFAELGLSRDALTAVKKLGYESPTPVQRLAIPIVLEGRDLIAAASTGTGKTAAFLLPLLSNLPRAGRGRRAPRVLVVTPTRELAQQIAFTCIKVARATGHFATTVYGGTPYPPQIREIKGGTDVLIATPGRLCDLMERGVVDLSHIEALVLDEADRMLDMGFLPDVTTIVEALPEKRQTLLFSATIDEAIQNNLGSLLSDPAVVQIAHKGETASTVEQFVMPIAYREKEELLKAVLDERGHERVIVFARTKIRAEEVASRLDDAGYAAESIHSDKSQGKRRRALDNFRKGRTNVLVATDVLARGIDVPSVDYVINLDLPDMPEDYVHRIGRTGRAGEVGYAISFVSPNSRRLLREIEKLIGREIPVMQLETYDLDLSLLEKGSKKKRGGKRNEAERRAAGARHRERAEKLEAARGKGRRNGEEEAAPVHKSRAERRREQFGDEDRKRKASSSRREDARRDGGKRDGDRSSKHDSERFDEARSNSSKRDEAERFDKTRGEETRRSASSRNERDERGGRKEGKFSGHKNGLAYFGSYRDENGEIHDASDWSREERRNDERGGRRSDDRSGRGERGERNTRGEKRGSKATRGARGERRDSYSARGDKRSGARGDRNDRRSARSTRDKRSGYQGHDERSARRGEKRGESRFNERGGKKMRRDNSFDARSSKKPTRGFKRDDTRSKQGKKGAKSRPAGIKDIRSFGERKLRQKYTDID